MHPNLISQLAADRYAELSAHADNRSLARQARSTHRTTVRIRAARPIRSLRLARRLRVQVAA